MTFLDEILSHSNLNQFSTLRLTNLSKLNIPMVVRFIAPAIRYFCFSASKNGTHVKSVQN
jgi:hypothetical protein